MTSTDEGCVESGCAIALAINFFMWAIIIIALARLA